jgi:deazaflavin-dependent oxidoreductase (nitroreductase family)
MRVPRFLWKIIRFPPQFWYRLGFGPILGRWILLLTTIGRKTGKSRVTALQYQRIDGIYYIGSARKGKADWVRNIQANPIVRLRVKSETYTGTAELISDPKRIADFLEVLRLKGPWMVRWMLQLEGLSKNPSRTEIEAFAQGMLIVGVHVIESALENAPRSFNDVR